MPVSVLAMCCFAVQLLFAFVVGAPTEQLWVGNYFGNSIARYDLSTGTLLGTSGVGSLKGTLGLSAGPGGVYACSELGGKIEKFDFAGNHVLTFATCSDPNGIVFDSDGCGYVSEFKNNDVAKISSTGSSLGSFVTTGSGGLSGPDIGLTFGPDRNLYVSSFSTNEILKYDGRTGAFIGKFVKAGSGGLTHPRGLIWRGGKLYVSSENGNSVLRYDARTGDYIDTFIKRGSGGLNGAAGMVISGDSLYVASWRNNKILKFDAMTGAFQSAFISTGQKGPTTLLIIHGSASKRPRSLERGKFAG